MEKKVLVTGAGIISAIGVGVDATLQSLVKGESGVGPIRYLPTDHKEFPVGEVKLSNEEMAAMTGAEYPSSELRSVLLGVIAAKEAVESARLSESDIARAALISGTTVGGMDMTERHFEKVMLADGDCTESKDLKFNDCGYSTDLIARAIGNPAMCTTTSTACSSAANAVIFGANLIKAGIVDIAIVGGTEALTRFHLNGFNTLMILDHDRCRPFDRDRSGINLGEGAAYIVIESEESARRRGVAPQAILSGYANTCDAFHQTASSDDGEGARLSMTKALEMASLKPEDIDYINAHGTGTPNNDITELAAMRRVWGEALPPFSSTKVFTGHTTSASGAIEAIISLLAINEGILPANLGVSNPIEAGAEPVGPNTLTGKNIMHVIDNSFGFGGNDSTLIFSKILLNQKDE